MLLCAAELSKRKSQQVLVDAMPLLPENAVLVLAGCGAEEEALHGRIRELGLEDRVLLPGYIRGLGAWYAMADAVVTASRIEGLPFNVMEAMRAGLRRFIIGLAKKVLLADVMGQYWGKMNASFEGAGALGAWLGLAAFSFQIFFDFSGYSDMALGLGKAMGFTFCENFDRPYRSLSLTEFWLSKQSRKLSGL